MSSSSSIPSPPQPLDRSAARNGQETQPKSNWLIRQLAHSMTGRVVMSTYETLKATSTSIVCLSPWGDSSPLMLPCIRVRDVAIQTVILATGGGAAIASPFLDNAAEMVLEEFGCSISVEVAIRAGYEAGGSVANGLLISSPVEGLIPAQDKRLETTAIVTLTITLTYKHFIKDASMGFFRASNHSDPSLFSSVGDYLAIEKGWFSPYLFASNRRPIIPRAMKPDIVLCHGPWLKGDYDIGECLLAGSINVVVLALGQEAPVALPPTQRRMVILVVGIAPHRAGIWTSSQRPGESVMKYMLLNGCPAMVVPIRMGTPLIAWHTCTLKMLQMMEGGVDGTIFERVLDRLNEYVGLCVDWERIVFPKGTKGERESNESAGLRVVKDGLRLILAGGVRSKDSAEVKKRIDGERAGIVFFRI